MKVICNVSDDEKNTIFTVEKQLDGYESAKLTLDSTDLTEIEFIKFKEILLEKLDSLYRFKGEWWFYICNKYSLNKNLINKYILNFNTNEVSVIDKN